MPNTLVRIYDNLVNAEYARNELLGCGFPASSVHLDSNDDEAGPVEGNFILDSKDGQPSGVGHRGRSKGRHPHPSGGHMGSMAVQRGTYVLTVEADSDEQCARAAEVMDRFGAIDVDRLTSRHRDEHHGKR
jgi:hypothetical protein